MMILNMEQTKRNENQGSTSRRAVRNMEVEVSRAAQHRNKSTK